MHLVRNNSCSSCWHHYTQDMESKHFTSQLQGAKSLLSVTHCNKQARHAYTILLYMDTCILLEQGWRVQTWLLCYPLHLLRHCLHIFCWGLLVFLFTRASCSEGLSKVVWHQTWPLYYHQTYRFIQITVLLLTVKKQSEISTWQKMVCKKRCS